MRTNIVCPNIIKRFTPKGKCGEEGKASVNEEYKEAFRTESYVELWGKLSTTALHRFSSSPFADTLIDPPQQALLGMLGTHNPHPLLLDYFHASWRACGLCETLLRSVRQTRAGDRSIQRVIKLSQRLETAQARSRAEERYCSAILGELSTFAMLNNPLSDINFWEVHDSNTALLQRMTWQRNKMRRRVKMGRWGKKAGAVGLVALHSAVMVAFVALAVHSVVGVVAMPAVAACGVEMARRRRSGKMRLSEALDEGAKGVYIMVKEMDTMSRMARRLQDEVEHRRTVVGMCARIRKAEVLREVVRDFGANEDGFLEQLDELEKHINLCFLTINRSRRLLAHQLLIPH